MRICKNKITDELRRLFNANPLRVPEALYQPLLVLQIKDRRPQPIGMFSELVRGEFDHEIAISVSNVAEISGEHTKKIGLKIGFNLLDSFVKAFGMQPATIKGALGRTEQLSFAFSEVERKRFSPLQLGRVLSENEILANTDNIFIRKILEDDDAKLAIVTDVIVSKSFSINTYDESDNEVAVDLPAVNEYLANIDVDVGVSSSRINEIKFDKSTPLTFAFCCIEIGIDEQGKFSSGDWLDNIRAKKLISDGSQTTTDEELEHRLKIVFDDDENNPLLIEVR